MSSITFIPSTLEKAVELQRQWLLNGAPAKGDTVTWVRDSYKSSQIDTRKSKAYKRRLFMEERHSLLVADYCSQVLHDWEVVARVKRFISREHNLPLDLTTSLAVVYKQGVRRTIKKANKGQLKAFEELQKATRASTLFPRINRDASFTGPVLEIPRVNAKKKPIRRIFQADNYDLVLDPDDPLGQPIAAAWMEFDPSKGHMVIKGADAEAFYDFGGGGTDDEVTKTPHGLEEFPGTLHRFEHPFDETDYLIEDREAGLVDAGIGISFLGSYMDWIRKSQSRKLLYLFGDLAKMADGQKLDPERPLMGNLPEDAENPQIGAVDFDTDPERFIKHLMFKVRTQVERKGVPQSAITFDYGEESAPALALTIQHEKLSALRNAQKPFAIDNEHSSQWKIVALCKEAGAEGAESLPDPDKVREGFGLVIPELNRVDEPEKLQKQIEFELGRGFTTDALEYQKRNPHLTRDESKDEVMANLEEQADFNELKTKRNTAGNDEMLDENQQNGQMGGRPEVDDED